MIGMKWTPKTGQVGSIVQPSKTDPMSKKRRNHSPEFKAKVALEALKGIEPIHALSAK